ncbi:inner membrane-spanning protein YciB [Novosphingobium bradum]|uniref:Inner membrane-spanning protein YciB n=1 Tax=Novosphingobium bradum TaxID=1737444 RepID=A0ABV7IUB1_9SPHN
MAEPAAPPPAKQKSGWLNLVVDYGPILVFFLVYKHFAPKGGQAALGEVTAVISGTLAFMAAAVVALGFSLWKFRRVSPMLWLSTVLIVVFGGLTVLLQDAFYIQIKPTAIYLLFGAALIGGWLKGRALLKILLEAAFEGLDDAGWMILSRNWGFFFLVLAALNEVLRHFYNVANHNFGTWIALKAWVFMPLSFLFTFVHMPMLLRHGLAASAEDEVVTHPPHE